MRPIGIDLFAGAGGMSLGFEQAGFDVVAAVEVDGVRGVALGVLVARAPARCTSSIFRRRRCCAAPWSG